MNKLYTTLIISFLVSCIQYKVLAGHIDGADISYSCTATPGIFEVTFNYYHQCGSGLPVCSGGCGGACTWQMSVYGADPGYTNTNFGNFNLTLQDVRDVDVKQTCPIKNNCTNNGCTTPGTFAPGMERFQFKGLVNLGPTSSIPAACCNVRISWAACCRSSAIGTGAADQNFYIEAVINRCLSVSPCNSSPVFKNDPKVQIKGGEHYIENWGAVDPDHDSLSYSFAPALTASGVSVTYNAPFSYQRPLPWTGNATGLYPQGISCDPFNGDIMFTPPNAGSSFTGILCVAVKQWKKIGGVPTLIGITTRDIPLTITGGSAPNNPPRLITNPPEDGMVNVPKTNWSVCAGEQLCFTITAKDTDFNPPIVSDTTVLRWDSALANLGATFMSDYVPAYRNLPDSLGGGPREDRYRFCWTPDDSLASTTPYYFTVSAADKRCPLPGELTRAFSILVLPKASAQINQTNAPCNKVLLSYTNTNATVAIKSASWRIAKTPDDPTFINGFNTYTASTTPTPFLFKDAGRFYIQLIAVSGGPIGSAGCVKVFDGYVDATGIQLKDSIQITNLSCALIPTGKLELKGYNGIPPYQYKLNNQPYGSHSIFTNLMAGQHTVWVRDTAGCETVDTVVLTQPNELSGTQQIVSPICHNDSSGSITIHINGGKAPYTFSLNQQAFQSDSVFNNLASGYYRLVVKDANACLKIDSVVLVNPPALAAVYVTQKPLCANDATGSIAINNTNGKHPFEYGINNSVLQSGNTFVNLPAGTYLITIKDDNHCTVSDSVVVPKQNPLTALFTVKQPDCFGGSDGKITIAAQSGKAPFLYRLNNEPFQSSQMFAGLPAATYAIIVKDSNNCTFTDSVLVNQPSALTFIKSKTAITCYNANDGRIAFTPGGGTAPYKVLFDSVLYPVPATIPSIKPGIYTYYFSDSKGCLVELKDTFVNPLQVIAGPITGNTAVTLNSIHIYTASFQSGLSSKWSVAGGTLLSSTTNPPVATVRWDTIGTGNIRLIVQQNQSCADTTTLQINIGSSGISELAETLGLIVYPNPAKNILNIQLQKLPEQTQIQLYDVQGKLVLQQELKLSQQLNIETLAPGMYSLKIGAWSGQVIKE